MPNTYDNMMCILESLCCVQKARAASRCQLQLLLPLFHSENSSEVFLMSENHKITKVGKDHHAHLPMLSIDLKFITRANKSHMFLFYKQKKKKEKKRGKRITSLN